MPGRYQLLGDIAYCEFEGVLTLELMLECRRWMQNLPKEPPILKQLIDLSGVDSVTIKYQEIEAFTAIRVLSREARRVIIARESVLFGVAREYQAYLEINLGDAVQIVQTREAALAWLNQR